MTDATTKSAEELTDAIDAATEAAMVHAAEIGPLQKTPRGGDAIGFEHLLDVPVHVTVEIGRTRVPLEELAKLVAGSVLTLDRAAHEPCDILVGGKIVARGEIVTVGENYGVRITSVSSG